jgi:hypothetical protein
MAKTYSQPKEGRALAQEEGGRGKAGVYRHPESGQDLFGNTQGDALARLGFVWVREAQPEEIKTVAGVQPVDEKEAAKLNSRLVASVLDQNELLTKALNEQAAARAEQPKDATDESGEHARAEAARQVSLREDAGSVDVTPEGDFVLAEDLVGGDEPTTDGEDAVKPLSRQNRTELEATAAAEGVEVTEELDTNKKLAEAVQAKRDETANAAQVGSESENK